MVGSQTPVGIERLAEDQFGSVGCHLFDIDAAGGAGDEHGRPHAAIDEHGAVQLALDLAAALHKYLPHHLPLGPGLDCHQCLAEQALGDPRGVGGAFGQFHAALAGADHCALAPAAGMDLSLDGTDRSTQRSEGGGRFLRSAGHFSCQNRHAGHPQQILRLVFVNLHGVPLAGGRVLGRALA